MGATVRHVFATLQQRPCTRRSISYNNIDWSRVGCLCGSASFYNSPFYNEDWMAFMNNQRVQVIFYKGDLKIYYH